MPEKVVIIYSDPAAEVNPFWNEGQAVDEVIGTVDNVSEALNELGYSVQTLPLRPPLSLAMGELKWIEADLVFNLFEGFDGWPESEAAIASGLEDLELCFTGSPSHSLRICENKAHTKKLIKRNGIATPDWQIMYPGCAEKFRLTFPCIVKPLGEHGSHGLSPQSVVWDKSSLIQQIEFVWQKYQHHSLVERFLSGREFRATIVENGHLTLLPFEEIIYNLPSDKPRLLTYSAKWIREDEYFTGTCEQCPANIDEDLQNKIGTIAASAFTAAGCRSYSSIDLRLTEAGEPMVIDINPNTDISCEGGVKLPIQAQGLSYNAFIDMILSSAKKQVGQNILSMQ